jgi:gamma-glutamylcyclotransferase (GGCT)/AIG2-like uncharacterized protein YtfP
MLTVVACSSSDLQPTAPVSPSGVATTVATTLAASGEGAVTGEIAVLDEELQDVVDELEQLEADLDDLEVLSGLVELDDDAG